MFPNSKTISYQFYFLQNTENTTYVHINADDLHFRQSSRVLFTASITTQNAAFLDGITMLACLDFANLSSTLPLNLSLWHRKFGHFNHDYVKQLITNDMVIGMTLSNKLKPDLARKMHANSFPTSYSRASQPLEQVHIDFKGLIQVTSINKYKYWAMFINDHTRFKYGIRLRKKSDIFSAFLQFKAYTENLHSAKIKTHHACSEQIPHCCSYWEDTP